MYVIVKEGEKMLGQRIKELRKKEKLTQSDLAKKLNLTHVSISGYERGERSPDIETLKKLATTLNTTTDYLLGNTNNPNPIENNVNLHYYEKENLTDADVDYLNMMIETMKKRNNEKE